MYLVGFPLLVIPFAIYNIIAFLMPGVSWSAPVTHVHLTSGADWTMSVGDILVAFTALILFVRDDKFARIGMRTLVDHALSLLLLFGMIVEFVWVSQAATATFFLMLVIAFVEAPAASASRCARGLGARTGDRARDGACGRTAT